MSLSKIISIPGQGGLFRMLAQMRNGGFVVESMIDQRRMPVSSTQRIIMLDDISIYTIEGEMPLKEVLLNMKTKKAEWETGFDGKDADSMKLALKKIIPNYDVERVRASDIKKLFQWYVLLEHLIDQPERKMEGIADSSAESVHDDVLSVANEENTKKKKTTSSNKSPESR